MSRNLSENTIKSKFYFASDETTESLMVIDSDDEGEDLMAMTSLIPETAIDTTKDNSGIAEVNCIQSLVPEKPCPKSHKRKSNVIIVGDKNKTKKNKICETERSDLKDGTEEEITTLTACEDTDSIDTVLNVNVNTKSVCGEISYASSNYINSDNNSFSDKTKENMFVNKNTTKTSTITLQNIKNIFASESNEENMKKLEIGHTIAAKDNVKTDHSVKIENYPQTNQRKLQVNSNYIMPNINEKREPSLVRVKQEVSDMNDPESNRELQTNSIHVKPINKNKSEDVFITVKQEVSDVTTNDPKNVHIETIEIKQKSLTNTSTNVIPNTSNTLLHGNNTNEYYTNNCNQVYNFTKQAESTDTLHEHNSMISNWAIPTAHQSRILQQPQWSNNGDFVETMHNNMGVSYNKNTFYSTNQNGMYGGQNLMNPEVDPIEKLILPPTNSPRGLKITPTAQHRLMPTTHQSRLLQQPQWSNNGDFAETMHNNMSVSYNQNTFYNTNQNGMCGGQHLMNPEVVPVEELILPPTKNPHVFKIAGDLPEDLPLPSSNPGFESLNSAHSRNPYFKNYQNQHEMLSQTQNSPVSVAHQALHDSSHRTSVITQNIPRSAQQLSKELHSQMFYLNPSTQLQNDNKKTKRAAPVTNKPPPPPYQRSHIAPGHEAFRQQPIGSYSGFINDYQYGNIENPISQNRMLQSQHLEYLRNMNNQPHHWPYAANHVESMMNNLAAQSNYTSSNLVNQPEINNLSVDKSVYIGNQYEMYSNQHARNAPRKKLTTKSKINPHLRNCPELIRIEKYVGQQVRYPSVVNQVNGGKNIRNQDEMYSGQQLITPPTIRSNFPVLTGKEKYIGQYMGNSSVAHQGYNRNPLETPSKSSPHARNSTTVAASVMPDDIRCTSRDSGFMSPTNTTSPPPIPGRCAICNLSTILKCLGCFSVFYCSRVCQMADWNKHERLCSKLKHKS